MSSPAAEPRPLLAFAPPRSGGIPARKMVLPKMRGPGGARQAERLTPQFQALTDALDAGRVDASTTTSATDPEMVVVFDLAGTVADFVRATRKIPGLEFLAELEDDTISEDEEDEFVVVDRDGEVAATAVGETLYLVWTDADAAAELVRLFNLWTQNEGVRLRQGLAPLKQVFAQLLAVRPWGPEDRVRETGLLQSWAEDLEVAGMSSTRVEIELWFRADPTRRARSEREVRRLVEDAGGQIINTATLDGIAYHGLLADVPRNMVEVVVRDGPASITLLTAGEVMFVSPARPMAIPTVGMDAAEPAPLPSRDLPTSAPRVALLDGLPMSNHRDLDGRLVIDDPDSYAEHYTDSSVQRHGTAMASLICHGDLNKPGRPLSTRLYVRPIMRPRPYFSDQEGVHPDELLVDLIHRSVVRILRGDGERPAEAPSVRVVNLSIGDPGRIFARRLSPLARLLDWLAYEYNLVVLVSAGNHNPPWVSAGDALNAAQHTRAHYQQARHRRLFSPAEALNVVTVGAIHADGAEVAPPPDTLIDVVTDGAPSVYGALGAGYRRAVKPEILMPGGRQRYVRPLPGTGTADLVQLVQARQHSTGPGLRVAAPGLGGATDASAYFCGTSGATALATNTVSGIFDVLDDLHTTDPDMPDPQFHPVLAKTLLVHAAHWHDLPATLATAGALTASVGRTGLTQFLGYGPVDSARVASAATNRVVLIGAAAIYDKQRHTFSFPLPAPLAASTEWRRLTITLGWLSPINPRSQTYRMARLKFSPPTAPLAVGRMQADEKAARRGTVQHEVLEGHQAVAFVAGDTLSIDVDCRINTGQVAAGVRYGIAATIEVGARVAIDLYSPIEDVLEARVAATVRGRARA